MRSKPILIHTCIYIYKYYAFYDVEKLEQFLSIYIYMFIPRYAYCTSQAIIVIRTIRTLRCNTNVIQIVETATSRDWKILEKNIYITIRIREHKLLEKNKNNKN